MTDKIDLDELDVETDDDSESPNRGDWFWAGDGDPAEEPGGWLNDASTDPNGGGGADGDGEMAAAATPRVPRSNDDAPVGIPVDSGGGGATPAGREPEGAEPATPAAGGAAHEAHADPDDMTMAFTYGAIQRLADPRGATAEARGWCDWIGLVGDVEAHILNKFQRNEHLDLDFFNGTGTGPGERLDDVDEHSMFFADRMVVVGEDGDQWMADAADWEFVHVTEAASKADWELTDE